MEQWIEKEHVYGNFRHYYQFNVAEERLQWLSPELCASFRLEAMTRAGHGSASDQASISFCDIGCNEGASATIKEVSVSSYP